jgi:hypothetical protein
MSNTPFQVYGIFFQPIGIVENEISKLKLLDLHYGKCN